MTIKFNRNHFIVRSCVASAVAIVVGFAAPMQAMPSKTTSGVKEASVKTIYAETMPSADAVEALGTAWGKALASRDPHKIHALYDKEAVLLATFTNELDTPTEIHNYFVGLTKREGLQVQFDEQNIRILDNDTATNSGLYTFSFIENGKRVFVPARYTFVYAKRGNDWLIVEHHSSVRPEKTDAKSVQK